MSSPTNLEEAVVFLVHHAPSPLGITQVMKLLFLAEVEHAQLYGEPLCDISWTWHNYGPFSPAVYGAVESLDEQGRVRDVLFLSGQREVLPIEGNNPRAEQGLTSRARRALTRVLERYGGLSLPELKRIAYATETMRNATVGQRLDVRREPRRSLAGEVPSLATILERTPRPEIVERGDPAESAAEDLAILREFSALRREANRGLS